jgi:two-component system OmpR family response regulator
VGVEDAVTALDMGVDDYLAKPFTLAELLARVRALTRRTGSFRPLKLEVGELLMDTLSMELWCNKKPISLTRKEYVIMEYLLRHPNMAISKTRLADYAWDLESENISNVVEAYIYRLRTKLNNAGGGDLIETVRGFGYRLRDKVILTLLIIATSFASLLVVGLPGNAVG